MTNTPNFIRLNLLRICSDDVKTNMINISLCLSTMVKAATKTCSKCHACKPVALFYIWNTKKCKDCIRAYKRKCRQNNLVRANKQDAARQRKHRQTEKYKATQEKNHDKRRATINAWRRNQYANNPQYAMSERCRHRMIRAVRAAKLDKKCGSSSELLGISPSGLKEWLEARFAEGMTWENRSDWHVDHIIPCASFDLLVDENQRICFWYKNLQPMWAKDNIQKSTTYTEAEKQVLISAYYNRE